MTVLEVVDKLKELGDKLPLSSSDKSDIEVMYHEVFGRTFIRTSCGDCYRDAVIEMYSYLKKYGICRICFRELAYKGQIPGVKKASW